MGLSAIDYTPPPTLKTFIRDHRRGELFYDWVVGPVGSGKTTAIFFKLVYMTMLQAPGPDGVCRTRAVIVRNTLPQLRDTTITSWNYWFRDGQAGKWYATQNKFVLQWSKGNVQYECEVLFRPLDSPEDVQRVLSLEVTFAVIDEFVQIPRQIVDALSARLGRYPAAKDGGATNWGMWGSSNPDTEDNWWYEYLHNDLPENATYLVQPSGFAPNAENIENLPGGRGYYENQAKGKSEAWIKQFIESEWGYSAEGRPVVQTFNPDIHVSSKPVMFDPNLPLVVGLDPGINGLAAIYGQEDLHGRLRVLGEQIAVGYGAMRFVTDKMRPYISRRFPGAQVQLAPDPAAASRAMSDEGTVVAVLRRFYPCWMESNNRLPLRLNAIEHYTTRLTDVGAALVVDGAQCPVLVRALKGGWRYELNPRRGENVVKNASPEKNDYSHPGDAFGYLCRYFHHAAERGFSRSSAHHDRRVRTTSVRDTTGASYHAR